MNPQCLMKNSLLHFLAIFLLILLSPALRAEDKLFDLPVAYYNTAEEDLSLAGAQKLFQQNKFISSGNSNLNFEFTSNPVWIHIAVDKLERKELLIIQNTHLDWIDIYLLKGDSLIRQSRQGDLVNFHAKDLDYHYPNVQLDTAVTDIFIRISSKGPLVIPVTLMSFPMLLQYAEKQHILHFIYFGILLLAFCVNVLLYIWFREKNYLLYLLSLLFFFVITCVEFGYLFQYLYPERPEINVYNPAYYTLLVVVVIFTQRFLNIQRGASFFYWLYRFIIISCLVIILAVFFTKGSVLIQQVILVVIGYIIPFFILSSVVYYYFFLKKKEARFVLLGWLSNVCSVVIFALTISGVFPHDFFTGNIIQIGSALEVIFFFLALVERINILKKEKEHLLVSQNQLLEEKLEERMREINTINHELLAQNEELQSQQDELAAQHDRLQEQNLVIEDQNLQLKDAKLGLEVKVKEKTADLRTANQGLADKNQRLEQFAFVASHNMRGPVATLAGLINLFYKDQSENPANVDIISKLEVTVEKLDNLLKDLSALLDFTTASEQLRKEVCLKQAWEDVKILLKGEIDKKQAQVTDDLPDCKTYRLIPVYVNNIFYNLLSNALKYSKDEKPPVIDICFTEQNGQIFITITDKGTGIDTKLVKDKLFSPFQRFHTHIEGRGLGLFITKTQIEAMQGTIHFESQPGVGTTVQIVLPNVQ